MAVDVIDYGHRRKIYDAIRDGDMRPATSFHSGTDSKDENLFPKKAASPKPNSQPSYANNVNTGPSSAFDSNPAAKALHSSFQTQSAGKAADIGAAVAQHFQTPTEQVQQSMLSAAQVPGGGGGILPGWNSPTGQNIDLTAYSPKQVDISAAGPLPPEGWLNRAITAARSGRPTYDTGGTKVDGNSPVGGITNANGRDYIGTPAGGTIGLSTGTNNVDNPFAGDRTNLLNAINKSTTPAPSTYYATTNEDQRKRQYEGGGN